MSLGIVNILRIPEGFCDLQNYSNWNTSFRVTSTSSESTCIFGEVYMYVNRIRIIRECG